MLIAGAGTSGAVILKEMLTSPYAQGMWSVLWMMIRIRLGKILNGVPIAGKREDIPRLVEKYKVDEIYIAMPSAPAKDRKEIIEICRETGCKVKNLPGIYQLLKGKSAWGRLREVEIEDLLGGNLCG